MLSATSLARLPVGAQQIGVHDATDAPLRTRPLTQCSRCGPGRVGVGLPPLQGRVQRGGVPRASANPRFEVRFGVISKVLPSSFRLRKSGRSLPIHRESERARKPNLEKRRRDGIDIAHSTDPAEGREDALRVSVSPWRMSSW